MTEVDLRIDARWVIPIVPDAALPNHSLLVRDGRIVAVVPTTVAARDFSPAEHVSLSTHALLPGLVNAHTHAAMSLLRGIADDVPLKAWLEDHIWPCEQRFVSPEFVYDGTLLAAGEMLLGGVTCCNDMYFFPDAAAGAYRASGMRAMIGLPVLDFATPYAADVDGYLCPDRQDARRRFHRRDVRSVSGRRRTHAGRPLRRQQGQPVAVQPHILEDCVAAARQQRPVRPPQVHRAEQQR